MRVSYFWQANLFYISDWNPPPPNPQTETLTILCFSRRLWVKQQTLPQYADCEQSNAGKTYFDYIEQMKNLKNDGAFHGVQDL